MRTREHKPGPLSAELAHVFKNDRRGHRAVFLMLRDEVAQALRAGYSIRAVHEQLRASGRVPFGYDTFRRHVLKHIPESRRLSKQGSAPAERDLPAAGGRAVLVAGSPDSLVSKGKPSVEHFLDQGLR